MGSDSRNTRQESLRTGNHLLISDSQLLVVAAILSLNRSYHTNVKRSIRSKDVGTEAVRCEMVLLDVMTCAAFQIV